MYLALTLYLIEIMTLYILQYEILSKNVVRKEKTYPCCTELYPSLEVTLEFQQKMKYQDGALTKAK